MPEGPPPAGERKALRPWTRFRRSTPRSASAGDRREPPRRETTNHPRDERRRLRGSFHIGWRARSGPPTSAPISSSVPPSEPSWEPLSRRCSTAATRRRSALATLFLRVDEKVALTKTLKTASREIGVRGRSVDLSPAELRRLIREGSRADAGFAAVGAPPALIDAISDLLMIPHRETSRIAADSSPATSRRPSIA